MGKIYSLYCNACGEKFKPTRKDARTCSNICRAAINDAHEIIKSEEERSEEGEKLYQAALKLVENRVPLLNKIISGKGEKTETKEAETTDGETEE